MHESFPLQWPLGRGKTTSYQRRDAAFKTSMGKAREELLRQLKLLGARNVVISSNIATYIRAGQEYMYVDQRKSMDEPGVAVYYSWKNEQYALACDRWKTVADNLQALNKTVEAIRGLERWGTGEMVKAAFMGFKELPAQTQAEVSIWDTLELRVKPQSPDVVRDAFRRLSKIRHPDVPGGSTVAFQKLNDAYQKAMAFYQ
jgi:hypothetical protein